MANVARMIAAAGALAGGYMSGKKMAEDREYEKEKQQREREDYEEKKALREKLKAIGSMGVTEAASGQEALDGAQQAKQMALSGAATDEDRAKVEADYAPTMSALEAQKQTPAGFISNGKFSVSRPSGDQLAADKRAATIAALGAVDPERAMNYEAGALTLEDKRSEAKFKAGWGERFKATPWGAAMSEGRAPSPGEQLQSSMDMFAYQAESGKASPEHMMAAAEKMKTLADEGYGKSMQALHSGASLDSVINSFNASGKVKLDPKAVTGYRPIEIDVGGGQKVKTHEITFTDASGAVRTINGFRELDAIGKAGDAFNRVMKLGDAARDDKKVAIDGGKLAVAQASESRAATKDARAETLSDDGRTALAEMDAAEQSGDVKAYKAARNRAIRAGIKLEKPEAQKADVKVGQLGDITVSQPTHGGGAVVTNYGPDMKPKGSVTVNSPGASAQGPKAGEEKVIADGQHKGKTAVFDGRGWILKQ